LQFYFYYNIILDT